MPIRTFSLIGHKFPVGCLFGSAIASLAFAARPGMAQTTSTNPPAATRPAPHDSTGMMSMADAKPAGDTAGRGQRLSMAPPAAPLSIPMQRNGSGTSWLPDATSVRALTFLRGGWNFMLHGAAFIQYDDQQNPGGDHRGGSQFGSVNWGMIAANHSLAGGQLGLRGMFSAEAFTVGSRGYPLLLQSGEEYNGQSLHDRQHPHDLFMELAALTIMH